VHCQGGCTKDRLRDPADHGSNHFCQSFLRFFEHADSALKRLAVDWLQEQQAWRQQSIGALDNSAPIQAERTSPPKNRHPQRNAPCPCGSGRKYKHCCGAGLRK
jgi:uncharacterized protein